MAGRIHIPMADVTSVLDELAEHWIGYSMPPPNRAIAEAQWTPDSRDAYCHRCGDSVAPGEATPSGCGRCRNKAAIGDGFIRLGPHEGELRRWVNRVKFSQWWAMGWMLGHRLGCAVGDVDQINTNDAIVVPMPMPWQRRLYRGIDHARLLADGVGRVLNAPVVSMLSKRNDRPQSTRTPSDRARYAGKGMRLRRRIGGWNLRGAHVVVVDDVRTSGGSMRAAVRLIRSCKPDRVICATVTVSDDRARRQRAQQLRALQVDAGQDRQESRDG